MTNGIGLYVHIPFCVHRCSYCDFFSLTDGTRAHFTRLSDGIERDAQQVAGWWRANREDTPEVRTVFFGGGTPSLLPVEELRRIVGVLRSQFRWHPEVEFSLEANPESLSVEWLRSARELGATRISLGAQSLVPAHLKTLERLASPESVREAAHLLREEGWTRFNLDLIFGIPGQTQEEMVEDIHHVCDLGGDHVSFYQLTLTPGHRLHSQLPQGDEGAQFYELGLETLAQRGFSLYEVSNFARPGGECQHNLGYWRGRDYLGLGPSAASRIYHGDTFHHGRRPADWKRYLEGKDWAWERSNAFQSRLEAVFLGLRTREGLALSDFQRRFEVDLRDHPKAIQFREEGLIVWDGTHLSSTPRGRLLVDSLATELVDP